MTDPKPNADGPARSPDKEGDGKSAALPSDIPVKVGVPGSAPVHGKELTADEQMALYEKELKENDWGHQPC